MHPYRPIEPKGPQGSTTGTIAVTRANGGDGPALLARRTDASHHLQVNGEGLLGEVGLTAPVGDLGHQTTPRLGKGLPRRAVAVDAVPHGLLHLHAGVGFCLLHQGQGLLVVRDIARQDFYRRD